MHTIRLEQPKLRHDPITHKAHVQQTKGQLMQRRGPWRVRAMHNMSHQLNDGEPVRIQGFGRTFQCRLIAHMRCVIARRGCVARPCSYATTCRSCCKATSSSSPSRSRNGGWLDPHCSFPIAKVS